METLGLGVLDFVGIEYGTSATDAIRGAVEVARAVEAAGYSRYWVSEHHNMRSLACSAPEILLAHIGVQTTTIRIGAAGIMLPNHTALKVAETFRTLIAMYPGRIDLALGRAPGTDPLTAHVLRRGISGDPAGEFPGQVAELFAFLSDSFPPAHPYAQLLAAPVVAELPELYMLGSSAYGPRFAAVNGMRAVFAHHMSPDLAVDALLAYRKDFRPRIDGDRAYSVLSVLTFASEDPDAVRDFEAGWTLTMRNLANGVREPLRPEDVRAYARSTDFTFAPKEQGRMITGDPGSVALRLLELRERAQADEVVVVTPGLERASRIASFSSLADAWRAHS